MKVSALLLALIGSAAAFAPAVNKKSTTSLGVTLEDKVGSTRPLVAFDPVGFASMGTDETFAWFRAAELKHSRVAMLASAGYLVQAAGIHFGGQLSEDVSFEQLSTLSVLDQWDAVPGVGKAQIIGAIMVTEIAGETQGTHYMKGGSFPEFIWPKVDISGISAEELKVKQNRELNNGRLAMIAIISFLAEANVPGSVPVLTKFGGF